MKDVINFLIGFGVISVGWWLIIIALSVVGVVLMELNLSQRFLSPIAALIEGMGSLWVGAVCLGIFVFIVWLASVVIFGDWGRRY